MEREVPGNRVACTQLAPSKAPLAATTALKSASALDPPPAYRATTTSGSVTTNETRGFTSGLKSARDAAVTAVLSAELALVADAAAAAAGFGTTARWNVVRLKLLERLG
jgi:hypothetical protein